MAYQPDKDTIIFSQLADKTITNTSVETSALGSGIGNKTILAEDIKPGRRIRIQGEGVYSSPLLLGSVIIRVKLGGTTVASVTTSALGASNLVNATNKSFTFNCTVVIRTVSATGKVVAGGSACYTTLNGQKLFDDLDNSGGEATVNTAADMPIDVTVQWDSASTSRSVKTTLVTIMLV